MLMSKRLWETPASLPWPVGGHHLCPEEPTSPMSLQWLTYLSNTVQWAWPLMSNAAVNWLRSTNRYFPTSEWLLSMWWPSYWTPFKSSTQTLKDMEQGLSLQRRGDFKKHAFSWNGFYFYFEFIWNMQSYTDILAPLLGLLTPSAEVTKDSVE